MGMGSAGDGRSKGGGSVRVEIARVVIGRQGVIGKQQTEVGAEFAKSDIREQA